MLKKYRFSLILVIVLALVAFILIMNNKTGTLKQKTSAFAVSDTTNITKLFFADKRNRTVKLERLPDGNWRLNEKYTANPEAINVMLRTLISIDVKAPVAKAARNNIIRLLAAKSVKTEVYQRVYRINLFGKIRLFPHEKRTRTYYVGDPTQDNIGTYMLMEGSDDPFVVYIPGFRGYVSTRYSALERDWREHGIFNSKLPDIKKISISYTDTPQHSFSITNLDNRRFEVTGNDSEKLASFDTLKVIEYLGGFRRINFESVIDELDKHKYDSITSSTPTFVISLETRSGVVHVLEAWRRKAAPGDTDIEGNPVDWDRDRMFARIKGTDELLMIQFFVFDRILVPLTWFTEPSEGNRGL